MLDRLIVIKDRRDGRSNTSRLMLDVNTGVADRLPSRSWLNEGSSILLGIAI